MKEKIEMLKKDLYNVFVMGNADDRQLYRVYLLIAVPALVFFAMFGNFPKY
ncbi:hypothetical protein LX99_01212 [Mucilaginibacter oryzae]|uniref:Uncharacterized protein n=1 Tax=Mucilaginibacter oryzae TaxID=468058 RepID=A0A316HFG7_9SPHI|nr:hypothetical protein [Mucilaginibacter oryzae]PWK78760.1 hypothetical protein LX99_01212 [Mucilaginibacter oryzae]